MRHDTGRLANETFSSLKTTNCFVGILFRFLGGRKYFYHRTFFVSLHPDFFGFLFLLLSVILDKFHFQIYIYIYIYIYIHASYHWLFSSGCGIMFMHLSRKSDHKKSFGILRTSEYIIS